MAISAQAPKESKITLGVDLAKVVEVTAAAELTKEGQQRQLKFKLKGKHGTATHSIFIKNEPRGASAKGSFQFINDLGQIGWASEPTMLNGQYFTDLSTARIAKVGEADLIEFLLAWLSPKKGSPFFIENFEKLFEGDLTEIDFTVTHKDQEIGVIWGVQKTDGSFYQTVLPKFGRGFIFKKSLNAGGEELIKTLGSFESAINKKIEYTLEKHGIQKEFYGKMPYTPVEFEESMFPTVQLTPEAAAQNSAMDMLPF
jgi:hypothetical protein